MVRQWCRCDVCRAEIGAMVDGYPLATDSKWCVDHDHETGAVRGLLCRECNLGLAAFRESPTALRRAAGYLERHRRHSEPGGAP